MQNSLSRAPSGNRFPTTHPDKMCVGLCKVSSPVSRASRPCLQMIADLIITNANLITLDDRRPRAAAMAVHDGRILYTGDDAAAKRFNAPHTRLLDLHGQTVTPGLCDAHLHLFWYGQQLLRNA